MSTTPQDNGSYDPSTDPDSDPEQLSSHRRPQQPDQAEGADDETATDGAPAASGDDAQRSEG